MLVFTQCDAVGPLDVFSDQSRAVSSVQTPLLYLSRIPPVRPVDEAETCKTNKHNESLGL